MNTQEQYRELMRQVFDELREGVRESTSPEKYEELRESFAFHMTDWVDDIQTVVELQKGSNSISSQDAAKKVIGLLYHMIPHLTEAGNLLLDGVASDVEPVKAVRPNDQAIRS